MFLFILFRVDMFIHQRWLESRLEISDDIFEEGDDYVTLLPEFFDNLWQPDPYFLNSKIAGKFIQILNLFPFRILSSSHCFVFPVSYDTLSSDLSFYIILCFRFIIEIIYIYDFFIIRINGAII